MPQVTPEIFALNSGVVSDLALARSDLAKMKLAATVQENLLPMVLGPAVFRPGTGFIDQSLNDEDPAFIPFDYNVSTTAMVVITASGVQFLVNGLFLTRPVVTAAITNGDFDSDLSGWSDQSESGGVAEWLTGGYLQLTGTGTERAAQAQLVTVNEPNVEHALRLHVTRGPVLLRVGTTIGEQDIVSEVSLGTGEHSRAFTPTDDFYVWVGAEDDVPRLVDSIEIEAAGRVTLDNPWPNNLPGIRWAQSGAVLFVADTGYEQRRIRLFKADLRSWGIDLYQTSDGPFRLPNFSQTTITPSDVTGSISLTSSRDVFKTGHVGALWRLTHSGQTAHAILGADGEHTDPIKVTGVHTT